jgi:hypothetical protein
MHALPAVLTNTCQRETASELAAAIVRMHRDKKANANCAEAGSRYVAEGYNVSRINSLIRDIARPALERRRAMTRTGPGHTVLQFGGKPHNNEPTVAGGSDRTMRVVFR